MTRPLPADAQAWAALLADHVASVFYTHATQCYKPEGAARLFDGYTPYAVHPTWCAMTILQEPLLDVRLRYRGSLALLYHDVPEDTSGKLPEGLGSEVMELVAGMTFASFDEEVKELWNRPIEVHLLKLYDKTSNWLDGTWMKPRKKALYHELIERLCDSVAAEYGPLNIVRLARSIL